MQLILDFGNTYQKCAVFNGQKLFALHKFENITIIDIQKLIDDNKNINSCILSSVIDTPSDILELLKSKFSFIELNSETIIPIINKYKTPNTLGKDRLAAAVAVSVLSNGSSALSIDMGTAIKFDIVNNKKEYLGGSISPGIFLRFKALNTFTAKLPLVGYNNNNEMIGSNTESSILSGVINGVNAEINTFVEYYKEQYPDVKIFITGGESIYFENNLKSDIFADSNLVLKGLNEILRYNE